MSKTAQFIAFIGIVVIVIVGFSWVRNNVDLSRYNLMPLPPVGTPPTPAPIPPPVAVTPTPVPQPTPLPPVVEPPPALTWSVTAGAKNTNVLTASKDPVSGVEATFQDDHTVSHPGGVPDADLSIMVPAEKYFAKTNLGELGVGLLIDTTRTTEKACTDPETYYDHPYDKQVSRTIGGVTFSGVNYEDPAAGNRYDVTKYRALIAGTCYTVISYFHYGVFENYEPGLVTRFSQKDVDTRLGKILNGIRFWQYDLTTGGTTKTYIK